MILLSHSFSFLACDPNTQFRELNSQAEEVQWHARDTVTSEPVGRNLRNPVVLAFALGSCWAPRSRSGLCSKGHCSTKYLSLAESQCTFMSSPILPSWDCRCKKKKKNYFLSLIMRSPAHQSCRSKWHSGHWGTSRHHSSPDHHIYLHLLAISGSCELPARGWERRVALAQLQCEVESGTYEDKEPHFRSRQGFSGPYLGQAPKLHDVY